MPASHPLDAVRPKSVGEAVNDLLRHDQSLARLHPGGIFRVERAVQFAKAERVRIQFLGHHVQGQRVDVEVDCHGSPLPALPARLQAAAQSILLSHDVLDLLLMADHHVVDVLALAFMILQRSIEAWRSHLLSPEAFVQLEQFGLQSFSVVLGEAVAWSPETVKVGT